MARRRRTDFDESLERNESAYYRYLERLTELAVSMFEWKNLPESVDERYMELSLFDRGSAIFFKDEVLGYLCLHSVNNGPLNVYRIPIKRRAFAANGYQKALTDKDSVLIFNNYMHTNSVLTIRDYARKLWEVDRTIDVNMRAQKTPILIRCSEQQKLTVKNMYMDYDGNAPVIFADKGLSENIFSVLKTDAPYLVKELYEYKTQVWNEALTYLGISNLNVQKKERLVSDEVTRSVGGTIASRYTRLEMRRKAAREINTMFGLDIEVNYRDDFREADDETMIEGMTGEPGAMTDQVIDIRTK